MIHAPSHAVETKAVETARVVIIGAGPAGLAAAEILASSPALEVEVYDAMPSVARKLLMAGKSGLNIAHSEPIEQQLARYGNARGLLEAALRQFDAEAIQDWCRSLGVETFTGSSGRIFPVVMKASPLLRAWLARLQAAGVRVHTRHRWRGWDAAGDLVFDSPTGPLHRRATATLLALGGASWPRLGSDGAWTRILGARGIHLKALRPANCGFEVDWPAHLTDRYAGQPVKSVSLSAEGHVVRGEFVLTRTGIEGSAIYALAAPLRDAIERDGQATPHLDLAPERSIADLTARLARPRGKSSFTNHLRKATGLSSVKLGLLTSHLRPTQSSENSAPRAEAIAALIKRLPITLAAPRPIEEAISSAGGVDHDELTQMFMLRRIPGVFVAGEMIDWEAPTGGYLLTACLATGRAAAEGVLAWIRANTDQTSWQAQGSSGPPSASENGSRSG